MIMEELVKNLIKQGILKTSSVIEAFLANDRKNFVPEQFESAAYSDIPLPLLAGQTISQPFTVAFMLELLDPKPGGKILDVGFGSAWTTAILASIVGDGGNVYGLELVPELFALGKANLEKMSYNNIELFQGSGWQGLPDKAPFDRILVSAAAGEVPQTLKEQLKAGGRMVLPVGSQFDCTIILLKKIDETNFEEEKYPGFAFVPLKR